MTTENEVIPVVRDLETLLRLGTYQGMSDEEIELVLNYKISVAVKNTVAQAQITAANNAAEQLVADSSAACTRGLNMLQSILDRQPALIGVNESV